MELQKKIDDIATRAKIASRELLNADKEKINDALYTMAKFLQEEKEIIQKENSKDLENGKKRGLSSAMLDRLAITDKTINSMIEGLKTVASLNSPLGQKFDERIRPNGLKIYKIKVPIGVIGIIYESRPNVTVDAAAICLKSQNAVLLRGGSEAIHSNKILASLFSKALKENNLPEDAVTFIDTTDREAVTYMLKQVGKIDLIIPRGGENLIKAVVENSMIPVIKHYKGVCHVYVSSKADKKKIIPIVLNAKIQRPGVCNAMETLLIDKNMDKNIQIEIINSLLEKNVELFGDEYICSLNNNIKPATEDDWYAEYLDFKLAIKSVNNTEGAIAHINKYGSGHTEAIISEDKSEIEMFKQRVDSSSVMVNASTRFADGGEYGMGCEIGISTDKLHARGPMGVEDLTTYKWIVEGNGQIRE